MKKELAMSKANHQATSSPPNSETFDPPTIDYPVSGSALSAQLFFAYGSVDESLFVVDCYFWSNRGRQAAMVWGSKGGKWAAIFEKIQECDGTGNIWVVAMDFEGYVSLTGKRPDLSVDPT